ncbi:MAG TPA: methionine--tRNA ligase [Anaerohalosphaeraceae bacterium]|nr:methionine--tRNA ligase [Phycisphaerae bacterium]HOK94607.1 methionine--tRNA ligase [Anaerohalosphaeraceae bacterium]HOL32124.1 methionine--tRNA ligase [Anaerohalosphaeraceae bacterium]HOM76145.1 methionine--tRNA ligase [Anaerohalosphaeraceae bacterium]HPC63189.1 methionine--tRNA ligase [Anaerohalosphaeraceae bacterium]
MRKLLVTSALPYANGPIHIGHLVEYLQTDIWVRFQKMMGNECRYFCADDTHGTPVMIRARSEGIAPEALIQRVHSEHYRDFTGFGIEFDNYYTTHSEENRQLSERIYQQAFKIGAIVKKVIQQAYDEQEKMWLPDRYIKGTCPRCKAEEQYGDSCDVCGAHYQTTELINPVSTISGKPPVLRESTHYFFRLGHFESALKELFAQGYVQATVQNKLDEWFSAGLKDWDISRDGPYFGFKIPGEEDKYFYVWLDAPIGYMASCKNYCDRNGLDFEQVWNGGEYEIYHFIGKDIMYFHALFWPALLLAAGLRTPDKLFVHGFLTVNGQKMSKSKGTFIMAETYLRHLDPQYLRYYYASKLSGDVGDIDLNVEDFVNRVNADLVGKLANLASRSGPMLTEKLGGRLGRLDTEGQMLFKELAAAKEEIVYSYENLNYAAAIRRITSLADICNKYVEQHQPWAAIKSNPEYARTSLTSILNAVRVLTLYLKPVLPAFAAKIEQFLNVKPLTFADTETPLENHTIQKFIRLIERIEKEKVDAMIEESKPQAAAPAVTEPVSLDEPLAAECTIEDFMKVDLRIARITKAAAVEGADKLLALELDLGALKKNVFAGIAKAYRPEELVGRLVVCVANLKPRKMKFGISEGMICASGPGGTEVFLISPDTGAKPGQRVH